MRIVSSGAKRKTPENSPLLLLSVLLLGRDSLPPLSLRSFSSPGDFILFHPLASSITARPYARRPTRTIVASSSTLPGGRCSYPNAAMTVNQAESMVPQINLRMWTVNVLPWDASGLSLSSGVDSSVMYPPCSLTNYKRGERGLINVTLAFLPLG